MKASESGDTNPDLTKYVLLKNYILRLFFQNNDFRRETKRKNVCKCCEGRYNLQVRSFRQQYKKQETTKYKNGRFKCRSWQISRLEHTRNEIIRENMKIKETISTDIDGVIYGKNGMKEERLTNEKWSGPF